MTDELTPEQIKARDIKRWKSRAYYRANLEKLRAYAREYNRKRKAERITAVPLKRTTEETNEPKD